MVTTIERKTGETANSLQGILNNASGTLTIPNGATVVLSAKRIDTGARVINAAAVTIVDQLTRLVRYDFADADLAAALAGVILDLEFAIVQQGAKPTYVPDTRANRLLLVINARVAA